MKMFDIALPHTIGLYAALVALPFALIAIRLRPARRLVPGTVLGAAVLMAVAGVVHLALITAHPNEPVTALLFLGNGISYLVLSFAFTWRWWRPASVALLTATLLGYLFYI